MNKRILLLSAVFCVGATVRASAKIMDTSQIQSYKSVVACVVEVK